MWGCCWWLFMIGILWRFLLTEEKDVCFSMNLGCYNKTHLFPILPSVSHFLAPSLGTTNFHSIMTLTGFRVTGDKHRMWVASEIISTDRESSVNAVWEEDTSLLVDSIILSSLSSEQMPFTGASFMLHVDLLEWRLSVKILILLSRFEILEVIVCFAAFAC